VFDRGGRLDRGYQAVANFSQHRELVFTHDQEGALSQTIRDLASGRLGGGGPLVAYNGTVQVTDERALVRHQDVSLRQALMIVGGVG
jgi:hypothetical protein